MSTNAAFGAGGPVLDLSQALGSAPGVAGHGSLLDAPATTTAADAGAGGLGADAVDPSMEQVQILPLGSGGEVGRSCIVVRYKGRSIMFDCGNHPAKNGLDSLPFFDSIRCEEIDVVLITHFHLDHCGALPYLCEQTNFKGRVFMTSATKAFYRLVMNDFLRIGSSASDIATNEWLQSTMERIETVEYHEEVTVNGIRFQPFNAGHVLGAAMFLADIAGMKVLYTGDFSRVPDRHLLGAETPPVSPDILIVESTNGIRELESREERERLFTTWVHDVVKGGGRCLVPVFALGRAQELLLILEEYWEAHKELQHIPIYYASSLAQRCMKLYQTFVSAMNDRVKKQHANNRNPFVFKYIQSLLDLRTFEDSGPCVVLASPGMLQSGISLDLFERWCGDARNGIVVAGYCVDGTIAKDVLSKPKDIVKPDGKILRVKMRTIQSVSFSAHSDGRQTRDFIAELPKTQYTVLVHGNFGAMGQLKNKLSQDFKDREMKVFTTQNQEYINIPFSVQRTAKVIGSLATHGAREGQFVNGVLLVSGQHAYSIIHPKDISLFTGLDVAQVHQAMVLPLSSYKSPLEVLDTLQRYFAGSEMFHDVEPSAAGAPSPSTGAIAMVSGGAGASGEPGGEARQQSVKITVSKDVVVEVQQDTQSHTTLSIMWSASRYNDLLADVTCIALTQLLQKDDGEDDAKLLPVDVSGKDRVFRVKCFHHMMSQFYTQVTTNLATGTCVVCLDRDTRATITDCIEVEVEGKGTEQASVEVAQLKARLKRIYLTLFPIPVDYGWCDCGAVHGEEPLVD